MLKSSGIDEAVAHVRAQIPFEPALAIVLGSGLAGVAATGAIIARDQRQRAQLTPEQVRDRLRDRFDESG